ncbi:MAG: ribosome silencing factor [Bacteroidetes bacterium]|nr:MAG: ribosome silencing factor [Bacteroidota bacterium]
MAQFALSKKASDVIIMDVRDVTDVADYFVVCSADSDTQVKAVSDAIMDGMESLGSAPWHREGVSNKQWVVLDYVDIVVHVFLKEMRKFYSLEKLWGDASIEPVEDKPKSTRAPRKKKEASE